MGFKEPNPNGRAAVFVWLNHNLENIGLQSLNNPSYEMLGSVAKFKSKRAKSSLYVIYAAKA